MSSFSEIEKIHSAISLMKTKCKCSHPVLIPPRKESIICSWCGRTVYKDEKAEFKHNLLNQLKKSERGV